MPALDVPGGRLDLTKPLLVGILNSTPDSFSDGGRLRDVPHAIDVAAQMIADGADMLDVGGESTRPGAAAVCTADELERVLPLVEALSERFQTPVSIDTRRSAVAQRAIEAGAAVVNDVSGFGDPAMAAVVRDTGAGWVLMHMPNAVGEMQWSTSAKGMPGELMAGWEAVVKALQQSVERALGAGVRSAQLALDPGLGFGKSMTQNLGFLRDFGPIARLGLPIYVGPSRKSFIGRVTGRPATDREMGTAAAVTAAVLAGASFVRVHDVAAMRRVIDVAAAIRDA
jgi:dihydropteroate synthase